MACSRSSRSVRGGMVLTAVLLATSGGWVGAQTTSASVAGTVNDGSGAVLQAAAVTLTSEAQGTERTILTDRLGNFFFAYVPPGTYSLTVGLAGFQTLRMTPLVVNAGDAVGTGTLTLAVGDVQERVTVTARAADMQLRSAERGFTLERSELENMGVTARNILPLAALVPGVAVVSDVQSAAAFSANGQRANSNTVTIDGITNIDTGDNAGNMAQTNPDAIAEFKVLTSNYQAEYGRAFGAQVHVVTRSGTRSFSGSGYWYGRRAAWDANTWWNNRSDMPIARNTRNDQGYTIGGPVYVPGLFNTEKKRLFFFWSQEIQRRSEAPVNPSKLTVPTALEREGDFSQSVDLNGKRVPYILDYTKHLPCGEKNTSGCFADGGLLGKIPKDRLYGPSLAVLNLFPLPNVPPGTLGFNYQSQYPTETAVNEQLLRTDYQVSDLWRVSGRYMWNSDRRETPYGGLWVLTVLSPVDMIPAVTTTPARNYMASVTGVVSNTTSVEIQLGSAHNSVASVGAPGTDSTRTGRGVLLPVFDPFAVRQDLIPSVTFGSGQTLVGTAPTFNTGYSPFTVSHTTYDVVGTLTKIVGSHALKAGGYYQRSAKIQSSASSHNGSYSFASAAGNPYDTQHPFANAALGVYNLVGQGSAQLVPEWQYENYEWYVQDNWRVGGRLTLDYGVRFYYLTPTWDVTGKASNFLPSSFTSSAAVRLFRPTIVNGVRVGYDAATGQTVDAKYIGRLVPGSGDPFQGSFQAGRGIDKTLSDGNKFRVAPRVGFAYDVTGKQSLVARGAFGIFYDRPQGNTVYDEIVNPPGMSVSTVQYGLLSGLEHAPLYRSPVGVAPAAYAWKVPTVYEWNAAVQARLPAGFVLDVAYVGSESRDLVQKRPINALPYGTTYLAPSQDPTRGQACSGCPALSTIPGANALPTDFLRPYQGYGNILLFEYSGWANYKALQTSVVRRFAKGLMLSFQYSRSKAYGISGTDWDTARSDGRDREANYGPLAQNRPNLFITGFVYRAPDLARGVLGYATNDWQLSGTYRWMTGAPYGVGYSVMGIPGVALGPNLTGSDQPARIVITGDTGRGYSSNPYVQFNTSAFQAPGPNSNGLESPRAYMVNPPIDNLDLSLSKSFPLGGHRRLEVRLDAFNALNHTQFSGVNTTAAFPTPMDRKTITNLPYNSNGVLVNPVQGFGTVSGVRPARQLQLMTRFSF